MKTENEYNSSIKLRDISISDVRGSIGNSFVIHIQ